MRCRVYEWTIADRVVRQGFGDLRRIKGWRIGMIKSWGFEFMFADPELEAHFDPQKSIDYFNRYLDIWVAAEGQGYEGVLLSEHHFGGGYTPSPNLMLPVIASRTTNLRLGVMGNVLPYHNPWRLAEEFGMLDNLLGGRLEIGMSAGIPFEFRSVGMETTEARGRFNESVEVINAALRDGVINYKGRYFEFENLKVVPRPVQQPTPPIWTTVISLESARKSGARGSRIATGFVPSDTVREIADAYNEAAAAAGNPTGPDRIALRRQVIIDRDEASAMARGKQFAEGFREALESSDDRAARKGSGQALDQPGTHGYQLGDDEFIIGSPTQVAAQIIDQCTRGDVGHFQAVFPAHADLDHLARSWELFGKEVIPLLKKA
ncbi:MAG: LLM class flavin-dependent oxidoreductase [Deltaproteobacteria bacterium]|nr:LLM class flavin-dependent oxidoreductase [Deltaproteobacteria bacterium]